jgi:hypothetical protein
MASGCPPKANRPGAERSLNGRALFEIAATDSRPRRRVPLGVLARVALGAALLAAPLSAQAPRASEYQIKAAFLFNFAQFVEWPASAFSTLDAPLIIGILGADPFGAALDEIVRGERIADRALVVRRYEQVADATEAHILFVGRSEEEALPAILLELRNRQILTVGEVEGFAQRGGMIGFVSADNRIRLNVNLSASEDSDLTISSRLLRAAEIVSPGGA